MRTHSNTIDKQLILAKYAKEKYSNNHKQVEIDFVDNFTMNVSFRFHFRRPRVQKVKKLILMT